jgi:hypothetical protein
MFAFKWRELALPHLARRLGIAAAANGVNVVTLSRSLRGVRSYLGNRREFLRQAKSANHEFELVASIPVLSERFENSGVGSGSYFHQDLYVAQQIYAASPARHVDVGSRVDGFVANVATFREIEVFDIRPLQTSARNITFRRRDLMTEASAFDDYTDSLSCLNALEHFGLGRYGDAVDYHGHRTGWRNLTRMLSRGGTLYFSVPFSKRQRIEFDAHRIFCLPYLLDELIGVYYDVTSFAFVDDAGEIHHDVDPHAGMARYSFHLEMGCAIFVLRKR